MFAVVILTQSKVKLVIPIKWVSSLDIIQIFNYGVSHTKDHLIFYSSVDDDDPDFGTEKKREFVMNDIGCYDARIMSIWGKCFTDTLNLLN